MSSEYVLPMSSEFSVTYVPGWFKTIRSNIFPGKERVSGHTRRLALPTIGILGSMAGPDAPGH